MSAQVGGAAVIVVDDAAKDISALDRASVLGLAVWDGGSLVNALMRTRNVVITIGELAQHPLQMGIIENEEMIEAFFSGSTDPAFRERICIRSPKGDGENVVALANEDGIECIREFAIVIADQEPQGRMGFVEVPQDLSGLLCDPGLGGVGGDPCVGYLACPSDFTMIFRLKIRCASPFVRNSNG
jgi:hypothetical protein